MTGPPRVYCEPASGHELLLALGREEFVPGIGVVGCMDLVPQWNGVNLFAVENDERGTSTNVGHLGVP